MEYSMYMYKIMLWIFSQSLILIIQGHLAGYPDFQSPMLHGRIRT